MAKPDIILTVADDKSLSIDLSEYNTGQRIVVCGGN